MKAKDPSVVAVKSEVKVAAPQPTSNTDTDKDKKKDIGIDVGSARITPYGTIYFNAFGNSGGSSNADVPIFATPNGSGNLRASVAKQGSDLDLK